MNEDDSAEKEFDPTETKLREARRKGDIASSKELNTAAAYGGLLVAGIALGAELLRRAGTQGAVLLEQADRLAPLFTAAGQAPTAGVLAGVAVWALPWMLIPALAVLATIAVQRALVFAPDKLQPKLSRISPIENAKQKFGADGLFEFAKSLTKLIVISGVLWFFLLARLPDIIGAATLSPAMAATEMMRLLGAFLALVLALSMAIGAVDYLWQFHSHRRKNRMTRKELQDETKQSEGDPHMKQQRRNRGVEIATNRMLDDVATADVAIVNPTHYAVALKWRRGDRGAPVCVAKGVDEIAARIRSAAANAGVPVRSDPPTARALHAMVEIGQQIAPEHYRAVAAAIRFAEDMRARARARWGG